MKSAVECFSQSCRSDTNKTKMRGEGSPPWGTPVVTGLDEDTCDPIFTLWHRPDRKDLTHCTDRGSTPSDASGMRRYSRNILQWNKNDMNSSKMTNGDYFESKCAANEFTTFLILTPSRSIFFKLESKSCKPISDNIGRIFWILIWFFFGGGRWTKWGNSTIYLKIQSLDAFTNLYFVVL